MTVTSPWEIVSWIGAICVGILIVAITAAMVAALIRQKPTKGKSTRIYTGK